MKHKIVFFDMDGTLYETAKDYIPESAIAAVQSLKDAGYIVAAATGRPLNQMNLILERLQFDYYVLINGGYILNKDMEMIAEFPINRQDVNEIVKLAKDNDLGLMFHFGDASYIYNDFYPMYDFAKYTNTLESLFYDIHQAYHKRHDAYNATILTKTPDIVQTFMEAHPGLRSDLINVKTNGMAYDIFNADNDKSHGIEMILNSLGLGWDDAIVFGDSTNDIQMLEKAGLGIAMGSANDYVKSFANYATEDLQHHGIYNAVKRILKDEQ